MKSLLYGFKLFMKWKSLKISACFQKKTIFVDGQTDGRTDGQIGAGKTCSIDFLVAPKIVFKNTYLLFFFSFLPSICCVNCTHTNNNNRAKTKTASVSPSHSSPMAKYYSSNNNNGSTVSPPPNLSGVARLIQMMMITRLKNCSCTWFVVPFPQISNRYIDGSCAVVV